jgi:hypothetical protein
MRGKVMDEEQIETINRLRGLLGKWCGNGIAEFPTISTFEYRDELEFAANDTQPVLHYEQRTWKKMETGEFAPSHWESGFWRVLSQTEIEILCAQAGGRVEISRGTLTPSRDGFLLHVHSTLVANDARMDKTARELILQGSILRYGMKMSTTVISELTRHVRAELTRCDPC